VCVQKVLDGVLKVLESDEKGFRNGNALPKAVCKNDEHQGKLVRNVVER
jgi:hypothetical protein